LWELQPDWERHSFSPVVKSMLYGIAPYDLATLAGAAILSLAVALAASWIPGSRAAKVQPMEALRRE
jgi:putative ABC transport system permease protein